MTNTWNSILCIWCASVANTQLNPWAKWVVSIKFAWWYPINCPGPSFLGNGITFFLELFLSLFITIYTEKNYANPMEIGWLFLVILLINERKKHYKLQSWVNNCSGHLPRKTGGERLPRPELAALVLNIWILKLRIMSFFYQKVFLMVIVNINVYKRIYFIRDHVIYVWIFILYVYIYIHVCM